MTLLEDGKVSLDTEVETNNGVLKEFPKTGKDKALIRYEDETGKRKITVREGFKRSSNNVFRASNMHSLSIDTLKVVENGVIMGTPDRRVFWNAQTPQVFRTGIYRRAHASALSDGFIGTDDSSLMERLGGRILVVEGKRDNIKLTVPEDFLLLSAALRASRRGAGEE